MRVEMDEYDKLAIREWAVECSIKINRFRGIEKIIADAEEIMQFVEPKTRGEIVTLNVVKNTT